jgi:17beta-estradiol 17-dehydrogenase / very-long-chain 3-oxoacyl-CoA reductase
MEAIQQSVLEYKPDTTYEWFELLCVLFVAYKLISIFDIPFRACFGSMCSKNLKKRYGDEGYAVVTGATDGIGLEYAREFARRGVNVMLISRTASKLKKRKEELEAQYPEVHIDTLAADFSNLEVADIKRITKKLDTLSVGVLVNNCGISYEHAEFLTDISPELVENLIEINVRALTLMTRIVLPKMYENKKGDIINVTSVAGVMSTGEPLYAVYSATKGYVNFFSRSLHHEATLKNVHVQCHVPHLVATKMSLVKPSWPLIPTPKVWAKAAVNHIGMKSRCMVTPYWFHDLCEVLLESVPYWMSVPYHLKRVTTTRTRALRKKKILAFEMIYQQEHPEIEQMEEKERRKVVRKAYEENKKKD